MSKKNHSSKLLFDDLSKQYKEWNKYSIWLLIATIGCWGIPNDIIKAFAMILVLLSAVSQMQSLEKKIKEKIIIRLNLFKEMYGQHLTESRLKLYKRKMLQVAIQQLWISVLCLIFVFISFFIIGFQLGYAGFKW